MRLINRWNEHLKENKMTYCQHMFFALFYGYLCVLAGISLIIHSIFPCILQTTGSDLVKKLNKRFSNGQRTR
jgi:hypothetical protein